MDVNKFFFYSALFSLLNAMNDYVACIRPLRGRVRLVTTWGCSRVVTNMVSEHKILEMFFLGSMSHMPHLVKSCSSV